MNESRQGQGRERGILLFGSELMMLRRAAQAGGTLVVPETRGGWQEAAELCRLGMLVRERETLLVTERARRALELTSNVPTGGVAFISPQRWGTL